MRNIIIQIKPQNINIIEITLREGHKIIDKTHLTVSQDFDILLIRTLDKLFCKNKIERLSLKSVKISGKMASGALWGMVLQTVAKALTI